MTNRTPATSSRCSPSSSCCRRCGHGTGMTRLDVWFDPTCPWTWTTTRWLVEEVAPHRDVDLRWHVMSLAVLNEDKEMPPQDAERMGVARRVVRLMVAVQQRHGDEELGRVYAAIGSRIHRQRRELDVDLVREALAEVGADADLTGTLDDASYDDAARASHDEGQSTVGEESGSPVLSLDGHGLFGPVLTPLPRGQEALDLWDGVQLLARSPSFSELKRPRSGPPDPG